jgi:hypothetical protein
MEDKHIFKMFHHVLCPMSYDTVAWLCAPGGAHAMMFWVSSAQPLRASVLLCKLLADGVSSVHMIWVVAPSVLVPSNGVFGRFDLVALCGCHTLNACLFVSAEKFRYLGRMHWPTKACGAALESLGVWHVSSISGLIILNCGRACCGWYWRSSAGQVNHSARLKRNNGRWGQWWVGYCPVHLFIVHGD